VYPDSHVVEVHAITCLDEGSLEQIACGPASREHESLVVIQAKPSHIHAAMLLAGFESGSPGKWTYKNEKIGTIPPKGEQLDISVRYPDPKADGKLVEKPIRAWIRDGNGKHTFPDKPWVFGGSVMAPNPKGVEPIGGQTYVADMSGSIIGLVTFGDEVIGFSQVISDQDAVQAPEWEVNSDVIPPMGTAVTIILRKHANHE
jgi:hypothetical protein